MKNDHDDITIIKTKVEYIERAVDRIESICNTRIDKLEDRTNYLMLKIFAIVSGVSTMIAFIFRKFM